MTVQVNRPVMILGEHTVVPKITLAAMAVAERTTGMKFYDVLRGALEGQFYLVNVILWACCLRELPGVTWEQFGQYLTPKELPEAMATFHALLKADMPDDEVAGKNAEPPTPLSGVGDTSSELATASSASETTASGG